MKLSTAYQRLGYMCIAMQIGGNHINLHAPNRENSGPSSVSLLELRLLRAFLMLGIKGRAERGSHIQIKSLRQHAAGADRSPLRARPWRLSPPPSPLSLPPPGRLRGRSSVTKRARRHVNRR